MHLTQKGGKVMDTVTGQAFYLCVFGFLSFISVRVN
jgi:hypothetical protein